MVSARLIRQLFRSSSDRSSSDSSSRALRGIAPKGPTPSINLGIAPKGPCPPPPPHLAANHEWVFGRPGRRRRAGSNKEVARAEDVYTKLHVVSQITADTLLPNVCMYGYHGFSYRLLRRKLRPGRQTTVAISIVISFAIALPIACLLALPPTPYILCAFLGRPWIIPVATEHVRADADDAHLGAGRLHRGRDCLDMFTCIYCCCYRCYCETRVIVQL